MTIKKVDGALVITGEHIDHYRLKVMASALKLECLGMTRRGRSMHSIVKEQFGFKGSKQKVLEQLQAHIAKTFPLPEDQNNK